LGPDGPSLGGFVCPATVITADLWKLGQLKAGDKVRFIPVDIATANALEQAQKNAIATLRAQPVPVTRHLPATPILRTLTEADNGVQVVYRPSGDHYLLVEYGPLVLDIRLRFRAHALMLWLQEKNISGVRELTPGIRSLQSHYDRPPLPTAQLPDLLVAGDGELHH